MEKNLIIEKVAKKANALPDIRRGVFGKHDVSHKAQIVSYSAQQAKNLGLKYLGFARYGKIMKNGSYQITHLVKNGRLEEFEHENDPYNFKDVHNNFEALFQKEEADDLYDHYMQATQSYHDQLTNKNPEDIPMIAYAAETGLLPYISHDYKAINRHLYSGNSLSDASPKIQKQISAIDSLFGSEYATSQADVSVYTGTALRLEKGKDYLFKGYLSASIDPRVAYGFALDLDNEEQKNIPSFLQINIKKGQKALNINALSKYFPLDSKFYDKEREVLLPRSSILSIKDGPIYYHNTQVWNAELDQEGMFDDGPPTFI
jgi:hypothetical protein